MRDSPDIIWFAATNFHNLQIVHSTLFKVNNLEYNTPETFKDLFAAWNIRDNRALAKKNCLTVSYRTISLREIRVDGTWRYSSIHTKNRIFITHGSGLIILILETCSVHIFIPINLFCVLLLNHHFTCLKHSPYTLPKPRNEKFVNQLQDRESFFFLLVNKPNRVTLHSWLVCFKNKFKGK